VKSSLSFANGNCVEVSGLGTGEILVRNSSDPDGEVLRFTPAEWDAFTGGVRLGEFDRFGGVTVTVGKVVNAAGADTGMVRVEATWPAGDRGEWLVRMQGDDFSDAAVLARTPRWSWTGYLAEGTYSLNVEGYEPASFEVTP
jgi:hypothetical protein